MNDYAQEFSALSLNTIRISSLSSSTSKRFVKFRFHNLPQKSSKVDIAKVDSGAEGNVMPLKKYQVLFPDRVGADGKPDMKYVRKSNRILEAYGGVQVPQFGTVQIPCQYN